MDEQLVNVLFPLLRLFFAYKCLNYDSLNERL